MQKHKVDGDLKKINKFSDGVIGNNKAYTNIGIAFVFMVAVFLYTYVVQGGAPVNMYIVVAAVIGAYMAMNIGANDVANNIGPAVGSKALTMLGALLIAAIFEAAGALIAGGDVVSTIRKGIIDPSTITDANTFIWVMMSALLSAALWLNLATWLGAPVSTTHSVVGGIVGAGITAAGTSSVNWPGLFAIMGSWVVSPMMGGIIAAGFLFFIHRNILYVEDRIAASNKWVPVLVGIMAAAFSMYLGIKGLSKIIKLDLIAIIALGVVSGVIFWFITKPYVFKASQKLGNSKQAVAKLFTIPLICSAALLSFAHGANDVANAVGPLAAIVSVASENSISSGKISLPLWVMIIGAVGISIGLMLFGPKLIKTVGSQITKLNQARAFCVALSAAITVIAASWLGQPVSSTHIAVGGVFGVGFLREYLNHKTKEDRLKRRFPEDPANIPALVKRRLVRRQALLTIIAAWVITVPASGLLSALVFTIFNGL
ncbi:inorganic phosphate transporter [Kordiimonas sp. SCSIO 12610]|uniref:inorganic phosphate transporter n=1 Tax=Kordiimonas sp. SCSIO 12610 TaxID=2829597 RepID=UPI00210A3319|nr:inorganic phosphate transporter [Kordiimonas sp. SCSIO 12610]UTW55602.1 inorganic phosphate transporter [Kordiimonas sp. SCSIO 12610]